MLIEQTLEKLHQLKLTGMAHALGEQLQHPDAQSLPFEDRLGLLVDREWDVRESRGMTRRLQVARLKQPATIEDIDFRTRQLTGWTRPACSPWRRAASSRPTSTSSSPAPPAWARPFSPAPSPTKPAA
jgi:hypothetical protein